MLGDRLPVSASIQVMEAWLRCRVHPSRQGMAPAQSAAIHRGILSLWVKMEASRGRAAIIAAWRKAFYCWWSGLTWRPGTLTQADQKTVTGNCVRAISVDPTGRNVYVSVGDTSGAGGQIHGFLLGPSGTLTELTGLPVQVEDIALSMAMHPSGKFLYAATPNLTVLDRDPATGILKVRGVFNTPKRALALNPAGNLLVASESGSNEVSEFHIDSNGNVIAVEQRVQASDPFGVAADPQGQFFAITEITDTTNFNGGLSLLKLNSVNGEYTKVNFAPFGSGGAPLDLAFEPTGKFVYTVFHNDGTVGGFVLDRNANTLTAIPAKPFTSGDNPVSLTVVQPR